MILTSVNSLPHSPQRIISLVPSLTELLFSLGLETRTIAITKFCVHPGHWKADKSLIGGTKALHLEKIRELMPDLIIANLEENTKEQVEALAVDFPIWVTNVTTLGDSFQMIKDIGALTDKAQQAAELISDIENLFSRWQAVPRSKIGLKAAYLIWKDPYMAAGGDTFINSMITLAGFSNVFGWKERYPEVTAAELKESGCDIILLSSEPYPFGSKHAAEISKIMPGIKVTLVDGEIFSWYGSRMRYAPEYFHKLLQGIDIQA